jgi:hypothetical protein
MVSNGMVGERVHRQRFNPAAEVMRDTGTGKGSQTPPQILAKTSIFTEGFTATP